MYHTCYCIDPVSHQMLSAGILGHSPVAQGFFQSYQPQMSASYPYSTPLGPLSPFAAVSGSLPVRYCHHILLTSSHWHLSTTSPFTLAPLHHFTLHTATSHPLTLHTATSPSLTSSHLHFSTPSPFTLPLLHPLTPEFWSRSSTTRADGRPWYWLHLHLPPPPVHRHTVTLPLRPCP